MINITENPYKSIQIETDEGIITVREGDNIEFIVEESGEKVVGFVTKFISKDEKLKVQIFSKTWNCELIWPIVQISEGTLKLVEDSEEEND